MQAGIATGALAAGDQLPTVRRVAVDLTINPNTVVRAYREMEVRGILDTQQGMERSLPRVGLSARRIERERMLSQLGTEFVARAGSVGFKIQELLETLQQMSSESELRVRGGRRVPTQSVQQCSVFWLSVYLYSLGWPHPLHPFGRPASGWSSDWGFTSCLPSRLSINGRKSLFFAGRYRGLRGPGLDLHHSRAGEAQPLRRSTGPGNHGEC